MLSSSFSIFKWPGSPLGPNEYLEVFVGAIQLVSCQDIVTLTGTVLSDPTGHTYYWEQTGGVPVTWLEEQNQLDVTFQKPSIFVDLFFRLWIDRYTPFQQYKDIIVTGTARDDLIYAVAQTSTGSSSTDLPGVSNTLLVPGPSAPGTVTINNVAKTLVWTNPSVELPSIYTGHQLYLNSGGVKTLLADIPFTSTSYNSGITPAVNTSYIIRTTADILGVGQLIQFTDVAAPGTVYDTSLLTIDGSDSVTAIALMQASTGESDYFQTQILTLTALNLSDDVSTQLIISPPGNLEVFQSQILSLESIPGSLEDTVSYALNTTIYGSLSVFQVQLSDGITVIG